MKTILTSLLALTLFAAACTKNEKDHQETDAGTPIDSAVVGKDTSPVSTRKDIEMSDEDKQTLPGRDTTNSDEPKK